MVRVSGRGMNVYCSIPAKTLRGTSFPTSPAPHPLALVRLGLVCGSPGGGVLVTPCIFLSDPCLLLGREVVDDAKEPADFLGILTLDHHGHRLARSIEQCRDVQVLGNEN